MYPTRLLCPWGFFRQEYWSELPCPLPGDLPNPGIKPRSPELQVDPLLSEPPGKPRNTGVNSLSLLQGSLWTQELKWGLLQCRWVLYQLSYQGSPYHNLPFNKMKEEIQKNQSVSSVAQSCLPLCVSVDCSTPGFPVHPQLLELAQTHVHQVGGAIQPSHPLSSPSSPAPNLS